jgi:hypothetical protein
MPLRQLAQGLHCVDHDFRMMGVRLGARTTVVQQPDGSVAVIGPGQLSDDDGRAIDALGPVRAIVAPNLMHHLFLGPARERWREARLVAPAALAKKRPDLRIDVPLDASGSAVSLPGGLEPTFVGGMPAVDEIVWRHVPSKTLVVTDLAFNVRPPQPLWTQLFMRLNAGWDRFGPTRILKSTIKDPARTRDSVAALLGQDFERVIVAHGEVLNAGGPEALRAGFAWLLATQAVVPAS